MYNSRLRAIDGKPGLLLDKRNQIDTCKCGRMLTRYFKQANNIRCPDHPRIPRNCTQAPPMLH
jgi:hypothetical protein